MLPSRRPSDDPGNGRMKLTERRRLVLGDVHISLEARRELLRRIDEIYAQLLALTNGDGDGAKLNGTAAPSAASLSPPPTEDSDASFDGDATLVPSPAPLEPEGPSPDDTDGPTIVSGTSTGRRDVLKTSRGPCVLFGPVPRTRNTGRRCENKQLATDGAPPVAAGGAAPQGGGVCRKEARQQPQRAPPAAKKVDAARGTGLPFRAKPLPVRILADTYKQQKKAEEEVRQLRSKARAEEMLRCAAMPFTTRRPMFQRQCSDPVSNVPVRETLFRASRRAPPATDVFQGDCRKARRSRSCPKLDDQRTLPERPVKPLRTSTPGRIKPNTTLLLRQQAALERRREEEKRRDEEEQRERVRTLRKSRVELQMRALECRLPRARSSDSIKDRLRAHRMAAMQRLEDYRQELQDIQDRVSSNPLLVERQALYGAQRLLEHQYERKLHELGLDHHFLESKAALHVQRRRSGSLDSRSEASGSSAVSPGSPQRSKRETSAAGFNARPRSASLRSSAASEEQSDTESARGSRPDLSQASGERSSDRKSAESASSSSIRTTAST